MTIEDRGINPEAAPSPEYTEAEVIEAANYAIGQLQEKAKNEPNNPQLQWLLKSVLNAKAKTLDLNRDTYINTITLDENGKEYKLKEGMPVDGLINMLQQTVASLPKGSAEWQEADRALKTLDNDIISPTFASLHGYSQEAIKGKELELVRNKINALKLRAKKKQEAKYISLDYRSTGDMDMDWELAEEELLTRRELRLPAKEKPEKDKKEKLTPEARTLVIANREADAWKRARELADKIIQENLRKGSALNPFNWPRKVGLRVIEDYWRQRLTREIQAGIHYSGNSYLNLDLARSSIKAPDLFRENIQALPIQHHQDRIAQIESEKAKVDQIKFLYENNLTEAGLEAQTERRDIIEAQGELRQTIIEDILRPMILGEASITGSNIATSQNIQQALVVFARNHQDNPDVIELFGTNANQFGQRAELFASDLQETANQIRMEMIRHGIGMDRINDRIGEYTSDNVKILLANPQWAAQTQANFNATDKIVQGMESTPLGVVLNPAVIGAAVSLTTFLGIKHLPSAIRSIFWAAPVISTAMGVDPSTTAAALWLAPIFGTLMGTGIAAARRNYDLKVDMRTHQVERAYNENIPQDARREALDKHRYHTRTVIDLVTHVEEALNPDELIQAIAEITTRLDFSARERIDLITFDSRTSVEQSRMVLLAKVVQARQRLVTQAHMDLDDIRDEEKKAAGNINQYLIQNKDQQDRAFHGYRIGQMARTALTAGIVGLAGGLVIQEGAALYGRGIQHLAVGETGPEWVAKRVGEAVGHPEWGAPLLPDTIIDHPSTETILGKDGTHIELTTGHRTIIPDGTEWIRNPNQPEKWDLVVINHHDRVLVNDAIFDQNGRIINPSSLNSDVTLSTEELNLPSGGKEILKDNEAVAEFKKLGTPIDHREWYSYDQPGSQGNELKLHTLAKNSEWGSGKAVTLDIHTMGEAFQNSLDPNHINVQDMIKNHESGFAFSVPGMSDEVIWIPDGADGKWDGMLTLDPNSSHLINLNGHGTTLGEFSRIILNQDALNKLPSGDIATELTNHQEVFKLGNNGKSGFIEAGRLVKHDGKDVLQAFATIRGTEGVSIESESKSITHIFPKINLEHPLITEINHPERILNEAEPPPIIVTPAALRHPLPPTKPGVGTPLPPKTTPFIPISASPREEIPPAEIPQPIEARFESIPGPVPTINIPTYLPTPVPQVTIPKEPENKSPEQKTFENNLKQELSQLGINFGHLIPEDSKIMASDITESVNLTAQLAIRIHDIEGADWHEALSLAVARQASRGHISRLCEFTNAIAPHLTEAQVIDHATQGLIFYSKEMIHNLKGVPKEQLDGPVSLSPLPSDHPKPEEPVKDPSVSELTPEKREEESRNNQPTNQSFITEEEFLQLARELGMDVSENTSTDKPQSEVIDTGEFADVTDAEQLLEETAQTSPEDEERLKQAQEIEDAIQDVMSKNSSLTHQQAIQYLRDLQSR